MDREQLTEPPAGPEATAAPEGEGQVPPVVPESGPRKPLSPLQVFWYSLGSFGCGTFFSFNNAVIPLFLENYTNSAVLQGLMGGSHSVEGAVIQPLVGTWSDRLRTPMGRRRPFILLFIPLTALFLMLAPLAAHLPPTLRLGAIVLSIFLFTVFFNIAFDPYQAMMPDITPVEQRGRVTSVWSLLGVLGQAGILLLPLPDHLLYLKFYIVGALLLVTMLLTCAKTREPRTDTLPVQHKSHLAETREAVRGLRTLRQAGRGLLVFFLSGVGVGAVLPFLTKFVKHITGCTNQQAQMMFLVLMVATALTVIPFGKLTDRIGAKRVLLISLGLTALAAINGLWISTLPQVTIVLALAGLGNAAQSAAAYPLMTQLVPSAEVGFYTGLQTMALSIFQPLTIVLVGLMIDHGSYRSIFAVCALCMVAALAVLSTIDQAVANREIVERDREIGLQVAPSDRTSQEGRA